MKDAERPGTPSISPRGILVFDGDCGFCRRWVRHMNQWFRRHPDSVVWQSADLATLGLTPEQCTTAVQFVDAHARVSGGADAVAR